MLMMKVDSESDQEITSEPFQEQDGIHQNQRDGGHGERPLFSGLIMVYEKTNAAKIKVSNFVLTIHTVFSFLCSLFQRNFFLI